MYITKTLSTFDTTRVDDDYGRVIETTIYQWPGRVSKATCWIYYLPWLAGE